MGKPRKKKNAWLFVDGTNLYAGQQELLGSKNYLNFREIISTLEKKSNTIFKKIYFYATYSPIPKTLTKKEKEYLKNEHYFYKSVKEDSRVIFFKGYRSKTSGKEKEVDVKLAVDIVDFAHRKKYFNMFLWSGDADFMHVLKIANSLKRRVFIVSLQNRIPNRFAYFYKTYILYKNNKPNVSNHRKQNLVFYKIPEKAIIKI